MDRKKSSKVAFIPPLISHLNLLFETYLLKWYSRRGVIQALAWVLDGHWKNENMR